MKKMKRLLSFTLLIVILLSSTTGAWGSASVRNLTFTDIKSTAWYTETVAKLVDLGIIDGYTDNTFRPNNTIKRDEFIKLTVAGMGYELEQGEVYWARPYIDKAIDLGLIQSDEFADYKANITREEMTSIIVNAALKTTDTVSNSNTYDHIKASIVDYHLIKDKYKQQVLYAYDLGIVTGFEDGTVRPNNNATRAEASTVVMRYLDESLRTYPDIDMTYVELKEYNPERYWYHTWFLDYMKVYPPMRNGRQYTEFVEVAQVLKDNMNKTEKFATLGYVSANGNVSLRLFDIPNEEKLEKHINENIHYAGVEIEDINIRIKTIDWDMNAEYNRDHPYHRRFPYEAIIYKVDNYDAHSKVVEAMFKELFGKDSAKAINELNSAVKANMKGNTSTTMRGEVFNINNRELVIENDSANRIDIYISPIKK